MFPYMYTMSQHQVSSGSEMPKILSEDAGAPELRCVSGEPIWSWRKKNRPAKSREKSVCMRKAQILRAAHP